MSSASLGKWLLNSLFETPSELASIMYQPGEEAVPGFRLVRRLGSGNFGEVWQAAAPGGTQIALKFMSLDEKGLREFRSLKLVKRVRHPNLVPIMAYWVKDADGNILEDAESEEEVRHSDKVSETLVAADLRHLNREPRSGPTELIVAMGLGDKSLYDRLVECQDEGKPSIPADELLAYMHATASALDYLNHPVHDPRWGRAAIQHRDVKPQNVLIVGGAAQVCDYGLARALDDTRGTCSLSPAYAAPESFDGKVCAQTDQYSLAVTYVELRTGNLPFHDTSLMGILKAHRTGDLDLTKLTGPEQAVIKRATAANPDHRYPSCQAMVAALQDAMSQRPEPARRATWIWVAASLLIAVPAALFAVLRWFPSVNVPAGFEADAGASAVAVGGMHYYDRISRVLPSGTRVPFVLIDQKPGSELGTFYIMETKVWNDLFREFAVESPDALKSSAWQRGAETADQELATDDPRLPAVRMTALEAHRFAEWLGGALPSAKQWDTAAGLFLDDAAAGPFLEPPDGTPPSVAVGRRASGPLPVGEAPDDVSPFGCRDMAGNGLEWTRTIDDNPSQALSNREIPNVVEDDLIVLRGRSYASGRPLQYDDLRGLSEVQAHDEGSPEIGLRVVLVPEF